MQFRYLVISRGNPAFHKKNAETGKNVKSSATVVIGVKTPPLKA